MAAVTPNRSTQIHSHGETPHFDSSFNGPARKRKCTDVFCCVIFIVVLLAYLSLSAMAWIHIDLGKLVHPTDSWGSSCGEEGTANANKPVLFYFNILKCTNPSSLLSMHCPTPQVCVSQCPHSFSSLADVWPKLDSSSWRFYRDFCRPGFNQSEKSMAEVLSDEDCPSILVPSRSIFFRCVPELVSLNDSPTNSSFTLDAETQGNVGELQHAARVMVGLLGWREVVMKVVEDFTKSWKLILVALITSSIISLLFVLLLRFTAALLLWTVVVSLLLLLAVGMWFCGSRWSALRVRSDSELSLVDVGLQANLEVYLQLRQTWLLLMGVLAVMGAILVLILVFLRRRVRVAVALLRESSRAVGHMSSTLLFPVVTFVFLGVCFCCWTSTALFLSTSSETIDEWIQSDLTCSFTNSTCPPQNSSWSLSSWSSWWCGGSPCDSSSSSRLLLLLQTSNLLLLCWTSSFCLSLQDFTLAGSFSTFYWTRKTRDIPACSPLRSLHRGLRYHCGSLAFGALILSVVQVLRIILEYVDQKLRGVNSSLSRFLLCCLRCCFVCLEKFIRYVNRNAFIMMAIYGKNFCASARDAFHLLMRNVLRVAVVDRLTDALLFVAKGLIAGGVGLITFLFFSEKLPGYQDQVPILHYHWLPPLTVVGGAFLVAHCFFSVYGSCVETLFLCLCDDLERNDGSSEKPYFMSVELHRILGKSSPSENCRQ